MRGFTPDDYPGVPDSHFTEGDAIRRVKDVLERAGFLVQETDARFDKGLDLLVSPTHMGAALPAIAAIQVKGGTSQSRIRTGRHKKYWAEMPLPVFGAVVPQPGSGAWADLGTYLRRHPDAASVPAHQPLGTLPNAIRAAVAQHNAVFSIVDLGAPQAARQLAALLSVWPLL